jgi:hypothetical protein
MAATMQTHPTKAALQAVKQSLKERQSIQVAAKMEGLATEHIVWQ